MRRVGEILRALFRRALREHGRRPPALTDILIDRAHGRAEPRLGVQFSNGDRSWAALPSDDRTIYQWDSVRALEDLRRTLLRDARSIYAQMLHDHHGEVEPQRTRLPRQVEHLVPLRRHSLFGRGLFDDEASKEAQERGMQLLKENLSPAQREQYDRYRHFDVTGGKTGKRYRIRQGSMMNVYQLDKRGRSVCGWCFFPGGDLVPGDVMLAQKTALELYEPEVLEIANRF